MWKQLNWTVGHVLKIAGRMQAQWREAQKLKVMATATIHHPIPHQISWEKPREGWYKLNVDAAVYHTMDHQMIGRGVAASCEILKVTSLLPGPCHSNYAYSQRRQKQ